MRQSLFGTFPLSSRDFMIYRPSSFARSSLIHLQEIGILQTVYPYHINHMDAFSSCLFFIVLSGVGYLKYDGKSYDLHPGDCVFIDSRKEYCFGPRANGDGHIFWALQWCRFSGPNIDMIYEKYMDIGGCPTFHPQSLFRYKSILTEMNQLTETSDLVCDMKLHEKLSSLLILLIEDAKNLTEQNASTSCVMDIQQVKAYLDSNYKEKVTLDELASLFFINKYYLLKLFRERYGVTVNAYLNQVRVTYIKQQLRFTEKTLEELADELHIEPTYLSRLFKKIVGITPSQFRKKWHES